MVSLKSYHLPLLITAAFSTISSLAYATPIAIPNASFESPSTPVSSTTNDDIIPGWVFVTNDKGFTFGTEAISQYFTSTAGSSGDNFAFIENFDTSTAKETITSAASLGTIAPLTIYTLTVAIGNVKAPDTGLFSQPGNISFSLLANGTAFATEDVPNNSVANGTWEDFTLTYTTPASGSIIGEDLTIQLASLPQTAWGYEAAFDNITLDASAPNIVAAPEPHGRSLSMVTLGALALCLVRRHQIR